MTGTILLVDDDRPLADMLARGLAKHGFAVTVGSTAEEAFTRSLEGDDELDAIVTDLNMPGMNGLELCARIVANRPDIPVVVITAFGSLDTAIGAIRAGAYDFLPKPVDVDQLAIAVGRAVQHRALRSEVIRLRRAAQPTETVLGHSPAMRELAELLDRVAGSDASMLITGESGTGKEVVARAVHARSKRAAGPFVPVNTAAIPEALLESELFGHVRGAFTGAIGDRAGMFVRATGGTLFLDEIGDMPHALQAKLLRALQDRSVRPVGSDREIAFDARIVCATHHDLESDLEAGTFRQDLYFRINVIHVDVPPLRARGGDILVLAQRFVERFATAAGKPITGLAPGTAERLLAYTWPGNVRELENSIERAVAVARFAELVVDDLPERVRDYRTDHVVIASADPAELQTMAEVERRYIARVLEATAGNKTLAAKVLGFDRKTLYNKLQRYELGTDDE